MVKITTSTTIRDIERWDKYSIEGKISIDFQLSRDYQPLEMIFIIQFLLSSIRHSDKLIIATNLSTDDFKEVYRHHYDYYILLSIILFKKDVTVLSNEDKIVYLDDIADNLKERLLAQNDICAIDFDINDRKSISLTENEKLVNDLRKAFFSDRTKDKITSGVSFFVPCFDHLKTDSLNESYYFYSNGKSKDDRGLRPWIERLFKFKGINIRKVTTFHHLSIVLKELMQNTNDWAKTSFDGEYELLPNLRASLINIFLEDRLIKEDSGEDHVRYYLRNIYKHLSSGSMPSMQMPLFEDGILENEKIGICEISVLDTGPGMARRWLGKDYPDFKNGEELNAVKKCFMKHITSDVSGKKQLRGQGLYNVITLIGGIGMIRVRTGRVSLIRDFSERNLNKSEIENGTLEFSFEESKMPLVEGTCVSILYPFIYKKPVA